MLNQVIQVRPFCIGQIVRVTKSDEPQLVGSTAVLSEHKHGYWLALPVLETDKAPTYLYLLDEEITAV